MLYCFSAQPAKPDRTAISLIQQSLTDCEVAEYVPAYSEHGGEAQATKPDLEM